MGYVYRYTDISDNIIKYVGIVWSKNRSLSQRIYEHTKDEWHQGKEWKIEYIETDINTRTDAEYMEAHFISLYETYKWFNISKSGWGVSSYLLKENFTWKLYTTNTIKNSLCNNSLKIHQIDNNIYLMRDILLCDFNVRYFLYDTEHSSALNRSYFVIKHTDKMFIELHIYLDIWNDEYGIYTVEVKVKKFSLIEFIKLFFSYYFQSEYTKKLNERIDDIAFNKFVMIISR